MGGGGEEEGCFEAGFGGAGEFGPEGFGVVRGDGYV